MEKNITLTGKQTLGFGFSLSVVAFVTSVAMSFSAPVNWLRKYYSSCLDREISVRQVWLLLNAQAAFFMTAFPVSCPIILRMAFLVWLLHALRLCKRAF